MAKKKTSAGAHKEAKGAEPPQPAPDARDSALEKDLDDPVPARGYEMLPMVGLGGSAGSIQALQQFFGNMPPNSGMVFVVVMHLSPTHDSTLAQTLQHFT